MKPSKLQRLAMAVAAAGLLIGGVAKAVSTEISASDFVSSLHQYVQNGEIAAAKDALQQLKAFGINQILIGTEYYLIDDILLALDNPEQARVIMAAISASVARGITAYFVAGTTVVASVNWATSGTDLFPTGSAG